MTLAEFLAPLAGGSQREVCLAVLYYHQHYHGKSSLSVEEIREELIRARVPKASKINVADVLNKSGALVDSPGGVRYPTVVAADDFGGKAHSWDA